MSLRLGRNLKEILRFAPQYTNSRQTNQRGRLQEAKTTRFQRTEKLFLLKLKQLKQMNCCIISSVFINTTFLQKKSIENSRV